MNILNCTPTHCGLLLLLLHNITYTTTYNILLHYAIIKKSLRGRHTNGFQ